jgi:hypothetical protein
MADKQLIITFTDVRRAKKQKGRVAAESLSLEFDGQTKQNQPSKWLVTI